MDILVTGGSGLVGWNLVSRLSGSNGVIFTYYSSDRSTNEGQDASSARLDIRNRDRIFDLVADYEPDCIIHTAALTDVDECERNRKLANEININGTENIILAAEQVRATLVFFSTSFVFDGGGERFAEGAKRSPANHYGWTKSVGEDMVSDASVGSIICRIDQPYCWQRDWQKEPFVSWVLSRCKTGNQFSVFTDWYNTPIYVPDCSKGVEKLLKNDASGIFHLCGPDYISRYDWARLISDLFGFDPSLVRPGHSTDANLPAKRPNNDLVTGKLEQFGISPRSLRDSLELMRDSCRKN